MPLVRQRGRRGGHRPPHELTARGSGRPEDPAARLGQPRAGPRLPFRPALPGGAWQGVAVQVRAAVANPGVRAALGAAALFGVGTPLAHELLGEVSPWLLAALLYLGSGIGLTAFRLLRHAPPVRLPRRDVPWLVGAIGAGGVVGPVLLMYGLTGMPASGASLLLNAEGVLTALLAWVVFRENVDRRVALGMLSIVAGALTLTWPGEVRMAAGWPVLAVLGACLAWAIDNNLTRRVSLTDATWISSVKGLVAGSANLGLALAVGPGGLPAWQGVLAAGLLGLVSYGVSLALFVTALRSLGTARAGAYFSVAPFVGAGVAVALGDPVTVNLVVAGVLMALGVWLHLSERHEHQHTHAVLVHAHPVPVDEHHGGVGVVEAPSAGEPANEHAHPTTTHTHPHYPDSHHRHPH